MNIRCVIRAESHHSGTHSDQCTMAGVLIFDDGFG
eukprot:SAG22_NODE_20221_length_267_cov_0.916667_1_plen_34_part_10